MVRRILFAIWWAALLLSAQVPDSSQTPESEETVYDLGPSVTPPRVIKQVSPKYPTGRGVSAVGSVIITLVVSSKGLPKNPQVVKGIDHDLDQSAVDAVKEWRFTPAQKDGKAVAVRVTLEIEFHDM